MAQFFGYEFKRAEKKQAESVVSPENNKGATVVDSALSEFYGAVLDLDGAIKSENDLIQKYRTISMYSDCDTAIDEIVNEVIVNQDADNIVDIDFSEVKTLSDGIKTKFTKEFEEILGLLDFNNCAYDLVRDWYIDGRLYYYVMLHEKPSDGISELRYIDPRKIKKIKNIKKKKISSGVDVVTDVEEFYIYNDKGITESATANTNGVKLKNDSVIFVPSGVINKNNGMVLGFLHKALKPVNQLKYIEDASLIYTITRAPERRIFYIDVGNMPKAKAEQYVTDQMAKFKNKIVYDANTGEVKDDRKHMSMIEDYWMPRRDGNKTTEITNLTGGTALTTFQEILQYFQRKLYQSLNVPMSRMQESTSMFDIGRSSAISRDEIKFAKFVDRLRNKFSKLFVDALRVQVIAKGYITADDWDKIEPLIKFNFNHDNLYAELKEADITQQRLNILQLADPFVGKYYSHNWIKKNILRQSEEEIKEIAKENEAEKKDALDFASHQGELNNLRQGQEDE